MYTITSLVIFFGFYALYNTSQKAQLKRSDKLSRWFQSNIKSTKIIGLIILLFSITVQIWFNGIAVGVFVAMSILMTVGSLIVIVSPLKIFNTKQISFLFLISMAVEIIIL